MNNKQLQLLIAATNLLPDTNEKVVLLVMIGNIYAGVSNEPLAKLATEIAKQIKADLE